MDAFEQLRLIGLSASNLQKEKPGSQEAVQLKFDLDC